MTPREIVNWLRDEKNRAVITMVGAAFAAALGGLWTVYVHFSPAPDSKPAPPLARVESDCGSVAVGGNVTGGTITAAATGDCAKASKPSQ